MTMRPTGVRTWLAGVRSWVAAFALTTLAVGLLVAVDVDLATARVPCPAGRTDVAGAVSSARSCGGPVEAMERRTPWSRTLIDKDGSALTEHSVEPRWVRRDNGSWVDLDTTLRLVGTTVVPAATLLPVAFSAGGSGPLATLTDGDRHLSMTWTGKALPAPSLNGATATYAQVLPGVDLRVTALAQGFSEVLVVTSAQAAANPALRQLSFHLSASGVNLTPAGDGGVEARDARGATVSPPRGQRCGTARNRRPAVGLAPGQAPLARGSPVTPGAGAATPRIRAMGRNPVRLSGPDRAGSGFPHRPDHPIPGVYRPDLHRL